MVAVALLRLLYLHPWLLQGRFAPPVDSLLCRCLGCFPSYFLGGPFSKFLQLRPLGGPLPSLGFHLRLHLLQLLPKQPVLPRHNCAPSAAPAGATISCLRIRGCRTQTRCLCGAPRCCGAGESWNVHTRTQNEPYLFVTGPHINICHKRGRTLLSQAPHTNESILCHKLSPRTVIVVPQLYRWSD